MKTIHDTTTKKSGKSPFGSDTSMIVHDSVKIRGKLNTYVVLSDEIGLYATEKRNVDSGLTDPYRIASKDYRDLLMCGMVVEEVK